MFLIQCAGCGTTATAECVCARLGHDPSVAGAHHPHCKMADPDSLVVCPPSSSCCQEDHAGEPGRRGHAVLECPADHSGHACPEPASCRLHESVKRHYAAMARAAAGVKAGHGFHLLDEPPDGCPGGHHGLGVRDCRVCRAVIITAAGAPAAVLQAVSS